MTVRNTVEKFARPSVRSMTQSPPTTDQCVIAGHRMDWGHGGCVYGSGGERAWLHTAETVSKP